MSEQTVKFVVVRGPLHQVCADVEFVDGVAEVPIEVAPFKARIFRYHAIKSESDLTEEDLEIIDAREYEEDEDEGDTPSTNDDDD